MRSIIWVFALLGSTCAAAQDAGFYVGAALGRSTVDNYCESFGSITVFSCSSSDDAWRIFGGYHFSRNFALEAAYTDMGQAEATVNELNSFRRAAGIFERKTRRVSEVQEIVGVASLPFANRWSLYGKFGLYRGEVAEYDLICCDQVTNERKRDLTYGIGVRFDFVRYFGVRAEWQLYQELGPMRANEWSDVKLLNVGLFARFF